jgi:hypothetical protein
VTPSFPGEGATSWCESGSTCAMRSAGSPGFRLLGFEYLLEFLQADSHVLLDDPNDEWFG